MITIGFILIAVVAIFTGFMSGLLGIGGAIIGIPVSLFIFTTFFHFPTDIAMHIVIGTCLTVMVFTTMSSALAHFKNGNIAWSFYIAIVPFMIMGSISGVIFANMVNGVILKKIFGIFLLLIALQMLLYKNKPHELGQIKSIPGVIRVLGGFFIGFKSGLLGIGGGAILIPLLFYLNYPARNVTGTTSVCSLTMGIVGTVSFLIHGVHYTSGIPYAVGYIYIPALLLMVPLTFISAKYGVKISMKISHIYLRRVFNLLIFFFGIIMLV